MPLSDDHGLADWIRLEQTRGVGAETGRRLLGAFGLPDNIFAATYSALAKVVPDKVVRALLADPDNATQDLIARTLEWAKQPGNHVLTLADADYPASLLNISDPPLMLYLKGRLELLTAPALAIVGSRNATAQGMANAERFADILSQAGLTIVSGMALGVDTAAHQGGLRNRPASACGSTLAVIGTGADIVYPARNRALAHQIAEGGCLISEHALGTPAIASNFPRRNRIISGLARGVLVVEAAAQSGSLITARMALEQGREVFAIPGSIHSPLSKGCHQLIKQGAKLVESAQDILEEIGYIGSAQRVIALDTQPDSAPPAKGPDAASAANPQYEHLLNALGFDPVTPDSLAERTGLEPSTLAAQLLVLELEGQVEMLPGGSYRRLL